jgi:hypothetical protein
VCKATKSNAFPLHVAGSSSLGGLWRTVGQCLPRFLSRETRVRSTPASGAGGPRDATFSTFAFTSPLIILLLVHLGISTLTAASGLIFRIALYILLKLAVVPDLSLVVDTQLAYYTAKPCPCGNPCNRVLHAAIDSKNSLVVGNPRKAGGKPAIDSQMYCDSR